MNWRAERLRLLDEALERAEAASLELRVAYGCATLCRSRLLCPTCGACEAHCGCVPDRWAALTRPEHLVGACLPAERVERVAMAA